MNDSVADLFDDPGFGESGLVLPPSPEDLFSLFEALEGIPEANCPELELEPELEVEGETGGSPKRKRQKVMMGEEANGNGNTSSAGEGLNKTSHITVERNRRKQMNEHLAVLRSLMPCFYVKRGDQASIIGGVVNYINELQQVLQSLESKKQRKVYSEVLSPRLASSPRVSPLSPRRPPLSLPISPRTPQPGSPYIPRQFHQGGGGGYLSPTKGTPLDLSPCCSSTSSIDNNMINPIKDLVASSKSSIAEVEVKFSGANVLLKTMSPWIPGQVVKIISALEDLALEILHLNISNMDETMHHCFTIKIGIDCQLSAEELAHQIQRTFC
ncbi:hypothetical protein Droror1_Dr00013135 [Drosera rotundifolia]